MTEEELKAVAKEMGYRLVKLDRPERLLPCTCGSTRRENLYRWDDTEKKEICTLRCRKCGKRASGYSKYEACLNWNEMVREEQ